ncbi:hypothetical protein THAOC_12625 [Thalassiosira oceanica]|uniref:Uncharacterized protein n=1 Tax=Thalassiosira oceanica TaxID=159749 RepID=K0SM78_THAOC|nr:hypothetical protein THAOC_12625 [Thalassiosira oceanica]|eukprot:EJK66460.1 hypothetical protein THAOC_12625 [Thalassiosira oceanica]
MEFAPTRIRLDRAPRELTSARFCQDRRPFRASIGIDASAVRLQGSPNECRAAARFVMQPKLASGTAAKSTQNRRSPGKTKCRAVPGLDIDASAVRRIQGSPINCEAQKASFCNRY